jgi:hypothetical protein
MTLIVKPKSNRQAVQAIQTVKKVVSTKKDKDYLSGMTKKVKTLIKKGYKINELKFKF